MCGVPYEHYGSKVTHGIGRTAVEQDRGENRRGEEIKNQQGIKGDSVILSQTDTWMEFMIVWHVLPDGALSAECTGSAHPHPSAPQHP